jgi:uncharacterized protein YqeY
MQERISLDINAALKRGDKATAEALRLVKSALQYAKIAANHDLSDEEATKVLRKEIKARIEARDIFASNDRPEQAAKEEFERSVYAIYVPDQLSDSAIDQLIVAAAKKLGNKPEFSQLMPAVMILAAGSADGKIVADRVKDYLSKAAK